MTKGRRNISKKLKGTNNEIESLLKQTIVQAEHFLDRQVHLLDLISAEDYQQVVNSFTTAAITLQSLIRFTVFQHDEDAEQIDLNELLVEIIREHRFENLQIKASNVLPTIYINRLRIKELFFCLLANAEKSGATRVKISCSKRRRFTFTDDRPKLTSHEKKHLFFLLYEDGNGQTKSNLDLFIAKKILDFYESEIFISCYNGLVRFQFTLSNLAPR